MTSRLLIPVEDLHCASCAARLQKALGEMTGVQSVRVHPSLRTVSVLFDPTRLNADAMRSAIEDRGFGVLGVSSLPGSAESLLLADMDEEKRTLWRRLVVGGALTAVVACADILGLSPYTRFAAATGVLGYGGLHLHKALPRSFRHGAPDADVLAWLSAWSAYGLGAANLILPGKVSQPIGGAFLESAALLVTLAVLGRFLEVRFKAGIISGFWRYTRHFPRFARRCVGGKEEMVPAADVREGDVLAVRPGESIPADGEVFEGSTEVDESLVTGERLGRMKRPGSRVVGGTLNKSGAFLLRVGASWEDSALSRLMEALREGHSARRFLRSSADRFAAFFVPASLAVAGFVALLWVRASPDPRILDALEAFFSILAVACPCALGVAAPMAIVAGFWTGEGRGISVRDPDGLEAAARSDTVVIGKTGMLTQGRPEVTRIRTMPGRSEEEVLQWASQAGNGSEHPFAQAVRRMSRSAGVSPRPLECSEVFPGRGILAAADGQDILAGKLDWLRSMGVSFPPEAQALEGETDPLLGVALNGQLTGALLFSDPMRPEAAAAVAMLKGLGLEVVLLSGDRPAVAEEAARLTGVRSVYPGASPEEKKRIVERLKRQGRILSVVGDDFQDLYAMACADSGLTRRSGLETALESADILLRKEDLTLLPEAIALCRAVRRVVRQNLFWIFGLQGMLIALTAATCSPASWGSLDPRMIGLTAALSMMFVVFNSLRLGVVTK